MCGSVHIVLATGSVVWPWESSQLNENKSNIYHTEQKISYSNCFEMQSVAEKLSKAASWSYYGRAPEAREQGFELEVQQSLVRSKSV